MGIHFDLVDIQVYCKSTDRFEVFEITIRNNFCSLWKCTKVDFEPSEFDVNQIDCSSLRKVEVVVPPSPVELLIATLPTDSQALIDLADLEEIEYNNRTYYAFFDLENGNWLAFDKKGSVYSIVHDAKLAVTKMKVSLPEILAQIAEQRFDVDAHFEQRYKRSK